tara:strand:- start:310 stop:906 length:597 start_codon:yes stop_codon:yes gene_type:complete
MTSKDEVCESKQEKIDIELCIICMDDNNLVLDQHPCLICDKKAWFCCQECISKLEDCPICRTKLGININIGNNQDNNNINNRSCYVKIIEKYNTFMNNHQNVSQILNYLQAIIFTGIIFFYILFLGKLLVYIFCTTGCDKEKNNENIKGCECYDITQVDNYWTDLMHNFGGNLGAGIMGHILIVIIHKLKCCSSNRNN